MTLTGLVARRSAQSSQFAKYLFQGAEYKKGFECMLKFGVITGSMGKVGDRYSLGGYKADMPLSEKLEHFKKIKHLDGVEVSQGEIKGTDEKDVKSLFDSYGMTISAIGIDLTSNPMWKYGSITSKHANLRTNAIDTLKRAMDFSAAVGTDLINIWLGQDGFDYPFQVDYIKQWEYALDALRQCADYNPNIRLALEPKIREPRNRCFIDSTTTAILLSQEAERDNVGITLDVGHILQEGKNMAQSIAYAHARGKLFNLHINDNYSTWDDDMIVGSVHHVEFIEMFYVIKKIGYDKWCTVDIFPYREDSMRALEESILNMHKFNELVDVIGLSELDKCIDSDDVTESIKLLREKIFR